MYISYQSFAKSTEIFLRNLSDSSRIRMRDCVIISVKICVILFVLRMHSSINESKFYYFMNNIRNKDKINRSLDSTHRIHRFSFSKPNINQFHFSFRFFTNFYFSCALCVCTLFLREFLFLDILFSKEKMGKRIWHSFRGIIQLA